MEELQKVPFLYIHVHRMGRYMVPRVNDNNPIVAQKTVSLDSDDEKAREVRQGSFKISKLITVYK